jgi:MFS family permease
MAEQTDSPIASARRDRGGQWYLTGILTLVYMLNFVDRGALNIIVEPVRQDLGITDVQMSLLIGFSFVTLYSVMSIPAGYVADLVSRRLMIAGAVVFWSGAALVSGFAGSYWQLFAGRVGLGAGEACFPPAAYSMLKDGVEEKSRGRAFSIYQAGLPLGTGLGALIGGSIFAAAAAGHFRGLPLLGHLKPWQMVIALPGLFGILVALLLLTVKEPPRPVAASADKATFGEAFAYLFANWRVYIIVFGAVVTVSLGTTGWAAWMAASLGRTWGLSPGTIGKTVGLMGLVLFPVAAFSLGYLMDLGKRKGRLEAPFWVAIGGCLLNLGPALFILHAPSLKAMWIAYGLSILFTTSGVQIACGVTLASVTPGRLMGKMTSFYYLTSNMLAAGVGPTLYALVSQYGFSGPRAMPQAMTLCYAVLMSLTVVLLLVGTGQIRRWRLANGAVAPVAVEPA